MSVIAEMLDTVTIETENGPVRINASEFDESTMKLAAEPAPVPVATAPAVETEMLVSKEGTGAKTRFFVTDKTGAKITSAGIDPEGYADEGAAWAAVMASKTA